MVDVFFTFWWCCENPREKNLLTLLLGSFAFAGSYVLKSSFDYYWLALGFVPEVDAVPVDFVTRYRLIIGIVPGTEEDPVPCYFFDIDFWSVFYYFSLSDDFLCGGLCEVLTFCVAESH